DRNPETSDLLTQHRRWLYRRFVLAADVESDAPFDDRGNKPRFRQTAIGVVRRTVAARNAYLRRVTGATYIVGVVASRPAVLTFLSCAGAVGVVGVFMFDYLVVGAGFAGSVMAE